MGDLRPFGVALGLLGNVMLGLSIGKLIGVGSCDLQVAPDCGSELTPYVIMLPAGIIVSIVAIFLGGGMVSFLGAFVAIGIGSLVTGFSTDHADTATFAKLFGGGFVGLPVLMLLLGLGARLVGVRKLARAQRLVATGARGVGTITGVRDTGVTINENPRVAITMRIEPGDGSAPFDAQKTVTVSRVSIPRAGDRFPVWYDRADPANWAYGTDRDVSQTPPADGPADELVKLDELRMKGVLTDDEFAAAKSRLLGLSASG